jgi:teichoic acid transport system ATP-binding protein
MVASPKVDFKNVSKKYTLQRRKVDKILEVLLSKSNNKSFYALRDVSFTVNEGETIGIIGINGSGKSTLSNLLAEVIPPTSGEININGETSLIAISVGLNNNLTGLDNIELKCLMHGLKKEEIKSLTPLIVDFADLGDFIDQPVKSYSSGMKSRLGFAISVHTNPDILIIDEALSVGDQTFYDKCIKKMNEFKKEGKTIFFISHSISQIRSFCDKAMWIHYGQLVEFGDTTKVLASYSEFIKFFNDLSDEEKKNYKKEKMAVQQKGNNTNEQNTSRKTRNEKKEKKGSVFQLLSIILVLFLSTSLMLLDDGYIKGLAAKLKPDNKIETKGAKVQNNIESPEIITINKEGYIKSEKGQAYQETDLKNKLQTLSFSEPVFVENKIGDVYEVTVNHQKVYLDLKDVFIPDDSLVKQDLQITEIFEGFPSIFQQSYKFYLVFLNSSLEEIEGKVRGKTNEYMDGLGQKNIVFSDITYRLNQDNIAKGIIIENFNFQNIDVEKIIEKATFKSDDNNNVYVGTENYQYIFDFKNQTVTIM